MEIHERIRQLRGDATQVAFAGKLGINVNTLRSYEKGEAIPNLKVAASMCQILGISPEWLMFGSSPTPQQQRKTVKAALLEARTRPGAAPSGIGDALLQGPRVGDAWAASPKVGDALRHNPLVGDMLRPRASQDFGLVLVPKVKARLCAGNGSLETEGDIKGFYAFREDWIHTKGSPASMVLMDVYGDSMEPDIWSGDTVLIDESQTDIRAGAIYAVGMDEEVVVKFVDKRPGQLLFRSSNERYDPIVLDLAHSHDNVRIIGRVIWWCREAR